jgi:integrase/recombinase XerD
VLSENFIRHHLFSLSLFYELLLETGVVDKGIVISKFQVKQTANKEVLNRKELHLLQQNCTKPLEACIIALGYGCGLRRNEMVQLNIDDIRLSEQVLVVKCGKNGKSREVPIAGKLIPVLKEYLIAERPCRIIGSEMPDAFFLSNTGKRMSGNYLNKSLKKIAGRCDNQQLQSKRITLHTLRHSIATHLMESGGGFEQVRQFLGHAEIDTTQLYAIRRNRKKTLTI